LLGGQGIRSVLVEGGAQVFGSFVREGLWDRLSVFAAPRLLGGGTGALSGYAPRLVAEAAALRNMRVRRIGGDILIEGENDVYRHS
jgi:diaminohydroxyphosphoribosylaminopyrimidine deaminase/5-amino-6-(5-phosphoribosylamino)uracil reductase